MACELPALPYDYNERFYGWFVVNFDDGFCCNINGAGSGVDSSIARVVPAEASLRVRILH